MATTCLPSRDHRTVLAERPLGVGMNVERSAFNDCTRMLVKLGLGGFRSAKRSTRSLSADQAGVPETLAAATVIRLSVPEAGVEE